MCDRMADLLVSLQTRRQRVRASNTSTARQESTRFCDLLPRVPQKHGQSGPRKNGFVRVLPVVPSAPLYGFM